MTPNLRPLQRSGNQGPRDTWGHTNGMKICRRSPKTAQFSPQQKKRCQVQLPVLIEVFKFLNKSFACFISNRRHLNTPYGHFLKAMPCSAACRCFGLLGIIVSDMFCAGVVFCFFRQRHAHAHVHVKHHTPTCDEISHWLNKMTT